MRLVGATLVALAVAVQEPPLPEIAVSTEVVRLDAIVTGLVLSDGHTGPLRGGRKGAAEQWLDVILE